MARILNEGGWRLGPDQYFDLNEENYYNYSYKSESTKTITSPNENQLQKVVEPTVLEILDSKESLPLFNKLSKILPIAKNHSSVRTIEQEISKSSLSKNRALWLISDWGMEADCFIWTVLNSLDKANENIYSISCQDYTNRESFLLDINDKFGCSFPQLCEWISLQNDACLIFEDIPLSGNSSTPIEVEIESMVKIVLQYCPSVKIILCSRYIPINQEFTYVELKPFEEADIKTYIAQHRLGGKSKSDPEVINKIFRFTDGVPNRIDSLLKDLEIVSISDITSINSDLVGKYVAPTDYPEQLRKTIADLSTSPDPILSRSYELLKVLTIFPQGEQLKRIVRFNGTNAFYPSNARELISRGLITSYTADEAGSIEDIVAPANVLFVPKLIREYVFTIINERELHSLNSKAIALYFGENWHSDSIKSKSEYRFSDPKRTTAEISNASLIIQRLMKHEIDTNNKRKIGATIRLSDAFCSALIEGDRFRSIVAFCGEFLQIIPADQDENSLLLLKLQYAHGLRMCGEHQSSIDMINSIIDKLPSNLMPKAYLSLALGYQSLGNNELALRSANQLKKFDSKSNLTGQADVIITEVTGAHDQDKKLRRLESQARKKKNFVTANNIALDLIKKELDVDKVRNQLEIIWTSANESHDYYNATRATIKLGMLAKKNNISLTQQEKLRLIRAYSYCYHQRFRQMFNECHQALWDIFKKSGDLSNLLRLYRHSSLIWRLTENENIENTYATELYSLMPQFSIAEVSSDREKIYFMARAKSFIKN